MKLRRSVALLSLVLTSSGCSTEAYCFVCGSGLSSGSGGSGAEGGGAGKTGGVVLDGGSEEDAGDAGAPSGAGGGDDCGDTQSDPLNCGSCGNACDFQNAFALCVSGECEIDRCFPGFLDDNGLPGDGCERGCAETNDGVELCDNIDNDCDGDVDEDFDLTSVTSCGSCTNVCNLAHASEGCEQGDDDEYRCQVASCEEQYENEDGVHENGCEYQCPVWPKAAESCNGLDDNCDGNIDEGAPGAGTACADVCPDGECKGRCTPGKTVCVGTGLVCVADETTVGPSLEVCDAGNEDEDCDGLSNEGFDLTTDVNHCGACNDPCDDLPNTKVEKCEASTCKVQVCDDEYASLTEGTVTGDAGCEYHCPQWPATAEVCDGIDNDCDGEVDAADASLVDPPAFCLQEGPCAGAVASCSAGEWQCNYAELDARIELDAAVGYAAPEQSCDGFDNNCDGKIDEGLGAYESCVAGGDCGSGDCDVGRCTCALDDDCSEGFACADDLYCRPVCTDGFGACQRSGTFSCDPGDPETLACDAVMEPTDAAAEQCNGADDNCDGNVDERNPEPGTLCYDVVPAGAPCAALKDAMVQVGSVWMYQYEASRPDADDTTAGIIDDDRACSAVGRLPWTYVNRQAAAQACAAIEDSAGAAMFLCSETDWEAACSAGNSGTVWAFSSSENVYSQNVCNDRRVCSAGSDCASGTCDDGFCTCTTDGQCTSGREVCGQGGYCSGVPWAGGDGAACFADGSNGDIYDLSGNVAEWTSSTVVVDGTTYYRVRGGSFTSFGAATACDFDFVLHKPTFANADVGFRCCSANAP